MVLTVIKREEGNPQRQSQKAMKTVVWRITHLSDYPSLDKWEGCVRKGIWQETCAKSKYGSIYCGNIVCVCLCIVFDILTRLTQTYSLLLQIWPCLQPHTNNLSDNLIKTLQPANRLIFKV